MSEENKELANMAAKGIVTVGGVVTALWIIYYLYDLLWK
jgi:hypothetical protein